MPKSTTPPAAPSSRPARAAAAWAAVWQDLIGAWRLALARRPAVPLDDEALHDLGLRRSELQSFLAEADGRAETARMRVIQRRASRML